MAVDPGRPGCGTNVESFGHMRPSSDFGRFQINAMGLNNGNRGKSDPEKLFRRFHFDAFSYVAVNISTRRRSFPSRRQYPPSRETSLPVMYVETSLARKR